MYRTLTVVPGVIAMLASCIVDPVARSARVPLWPAQLCSYWREPTPVLEKIETYSKSGRWWRFRWTPGTIELRLPPLVIGGANP
jgi:hypothetical protein